MLILNNHGSHVTADFLRFALNERVVILAFPPHTTHLLQPLNVGLFAPLSTYYSGLVQSAARWGNCSGIDKALFLAYYDDARKRAFTKQNIISAWRALGLQPLSARPSKLRMTAESERRLAASRPNALQYQRPYSDLEAYDTLPGWPWTPKKPNEAKYMQYEIENGHLTSSPVALRVHKLTKGFLALEAALAVATTSLQQYEKHKIDKASNKRLQSSGRVFTEDDYDRVRKDEVKRKQAAGQAQTRRKYEDGTFAPEIEAASFDFSVVNPAEAAQPHGPFSHVFRVDYQGVNAGCVARKWDGRSRFCGATSAPIMKINNFKFKPIMLEDAIIE